jgi:surfactin synthase thioesterase subunit
MTAGIRDNGKWLRYYGPRVTGKLRLFCFHYAGGNAAMFRDWPAKLPAEIELVAIQLPGRDDRHGEPPYEHMEPLVTDLVGVLEPLLDRPFACWGFSMGARVALAFAHALRERSLPAPVELFVASSAAPRMRLPVRGWDEPDEGLVDYLRELGRTPPPLFEDPELLGLFLPTVRADLKVIGTCPVPDRPLLTVPIGAFAGADDPEASPARMLPWREETGAEFHLDVVPGGHFLSPEGMRQALDSTARDLMRATSCTPALPSATVSPVRAVPLRG